MQNVNQKKNPLLPKAWIPVAMVCFLMEKDPTKLVKSHRLYVDLQEEVERELGGSPLVYLVWDCQCLNIYVATCDLKQVDQVARL